MGFKPQLGDSDQGKGRGALTERSLPARCLQSQRDNGKSRKGKEGRVRVRQLPRLTPAGYAAQAPFPVVLTVFPDKERSRGKDGSVCVCVCGVGG